MKLPIYIYGSQVLRDPSKEADLSDKETLKTLVENMKETLEGADGLSLIHI